MGCWDIFCLLCGNTCHSPLNGIEENLSEGIEYYESIKDSKNKKKNGLLIIIQTFIKIIKKIQNFFYLK